MTALARGAAVAAAVVGTLGGCAHHRQTVVELREVHEHLLTLRDQGRARVDAMEEDVGMTNAVTGEDPSRRVVWIDLDRAVMVDGQTFTLRQLADGCPNRPPQPVEELERPCGLFIHRDASFVYSERSYWNANSYKALATGLAGLAAGGGAIYCGLECSDYPRLKAAGLGVSSFFLLIASAIYSGGRD